MDPAELLSRALHDQPDAWRTLLAQVGARTVGAWLSTGALRAAMLADSAFAREMLVALRGNDALAASVAAAFPEASALAAPMAAQVEHDAGSDRPLLDHIERALGRLAALEANDRAAFQRAEGLSEAAFARLAAIARGVVEVGLAAPLRAAILHLDIAKTQSAAHRAAWQAEGITLDVHNEAAAAILARHGRAAEWPMSPALGALAIAFVEAHGLAGQHVRGEGPLAMFAPLVEALRALGPALGGALHLAPADAVRRALDALHVLDACDTGAVREGLLDDALLARLAAVRDRLAAACADARPPLAALAEPPAATTAEIRARLADRLRALRSGRQRVGEPPEAVTAAVAALGEQELAALAPALATCQLWYCEAATSALSPSAQLAILAAAVGAARAASVDTSRPWHAQLRPLVARMSEHGDDARAARYRVRLVEAALAAVPIRSLLVGGAKLGPLGALSARLSAAHDGTAPDAIVLDYTETPESASLVTLLALYETRSQVAYHAMLKALCDLYGLRKDAFDRVANEANYLATMNAARSDKARMLDLVRPGRIVEIGPGGGVVLDLLAERFPDSELIGVDLSREVIAALANQARARGATWRVVEGAAEDLARLVPTPVDTVVFCSILHEVYSYTPPRFQLAAVARVVASAFGTLAPGGRLVIRDGVRPPPGARRIRFVAPDARATFDRYVAEFEGRAIAFTDLAPDRVELSTADAMEFLYTYTWGPASFPYEVRELYGILEYGAYVASLIEWCGGPSRARALDIPDASYLQPGYRENLAGKIELTDERDAPADLPDSNCLIAIERVG